VLSESSDTLWYAIIAQRLSLVTVHLIILFQRPAPHVADGEKPKCRLYSRLNWAGLL
jgi:hypothetical protein